MIIRNDDLSFDTNLDDFKIFCDICDKYKVDIIQAVTPIGKTRDIQRVWTDEQIVAYSGNHTIFHNYPLIKYILSERIFDEIAVHGLWHTHKPSLLDQHISAKLIRSGFDDNFDVKSVVWPFNEVGEKSSYFDYIEDNDRLEDFLPGMPKEHEVPKTETVYLHSWRFDGSFYSFNDLDVCLKRILE